MSTAPVPPTPPKQSNLLWWILGVIGGGVVVLVLGGLFLAGTFLKGIRSSRNADVEITTPVGKISVNKTAAKDVGLPIYPGASLVEEGARIEVGLPEEQQLGIAAVHYRTSDAAEKVDEWYRARLGPDYERQGPGHVHATFRFKGLRIEKDDIAYISDRNDLMRIVAIARKWDGTEIALVRIGAQETQ